MTFLSPIYSLKPPVHTLSLRMALGMMLGLYALLAVAGIILSRHPGSVATVWWANAAAVIIMQTRPRRDWYSLLAATGLANIFAHIACGDQTWRALSFLPGALLEITAAAYLFGRFCLPHRALALPLNYLGTVLVTGVLPAALGATAGSAVLAWQGIMPWYEAWLSWFLGSLFGIVTLLPLGLQWLQTGQLLPSRPDRGWGSVLVLLLSLAATGFCLLHMLYPYVYVVSLATLAIMVVGFGLAGWTIFLHGLVIVLANALGWLYSDLSQDVWTRLNLFTPMLLAAIEPMLLVTLLRSNQLLHEENRNLLDEVSQQLVETLAMLENTPSAVRVARLDDDSVVFVNQRYRDIFRLSPGMEAEIDISSYYVNPDQFSQISEELRQHGVVKNRLVTLQAPNHPELPFVWAKASYVVIDFQGRKSALAWFNDVTDLYDAMARAEDLYNNSPAGYMTLLADGTIEGLNETQLKWLGFDRSEIEGKLRLQDLLLSESVEAFERHFEQIKVTGQSGGVEVDLVRKDRSILNAQLATFSVCDAQGNFLYSRTTLHDIGELKCLQQAISQGKRDLEAVLDNIPMAVAYVGADLRMRFGNRTTCEWFGVASEELVGFDFSQLLAQERLQAVLPHIHQALAGKRQIFEHLVFSCAHQRQLNLLFNYIPDMLDGEVHGFYLVASDVSQVKEAAEAANRAKGEFLANMSHEIRTPINGVMGYLQLMSREPLGDKMRAYVSESLSATRLLLRVLNDVLDFSKIEAGKLDIHAELSDLRRMFGEVHGLMQAQLGGRALELRLDIDERLPRFALADDMRLRQVLVNLTSNAIKFTEHGAVTLHVAGELLPDEQFRLQVQVQDTGIGIGEQQLSHLFQAFHQADGGITRRFGGSGLGLVISQRLLKLMGSEGLRVQSVEGQGSVFSFELVLKEVPPEALPMPVEADAGGAAVAGLDEPLRGRSILLVEDNPTNIDVALNMLESLGAQVTIATNGRDALDVLQELGPCFDLVLMDMQMPEMDGLEATRRIKAEPRWAGLPVVAMTANAMEQDRRACLEVGMADHLSKPFELDELVRIASLYLRPVPDLEITDLGDNVAELALSSRKS